MKGVRKSNQENYEERQSFARKMFEEDCRARQAEGWIDPPLSAPKAQKEFHKRFKVRMNSQRMYDIRRSVFAQFGLDKKGRPIRNGKHLAGVPQLQPVAGPTIQAAHRNPDDPLFHVVVVPTPDREHGEFLKGAVAKMAMAGLVGSNMRVAVDDNRYCTVTDYPSE